MRNDLNYSYSGHWEIFNIVNNLDNEAEDRYGANENKKKKAEEKLVSRTLFSICRPFIFHPVFNQMVVVERRKCRSHYQWALFRGE